MFNHQKYRPFQAIDLPNRQWPNKTIHTAPFWCAVDLRDGNQALIEPMNISQKQALWHLMVDMGFKEIEVGFPSASQTDFDFVRWLIEEQKIPADVSIQVLVQARDHLIMRTFEALVGAKRAIVHVYNSTSKVQRDKVFKLDQQGIINIAVQGAEKLQSEAKKYPATHFTFQYSPESFSGTEMAFAADICNAVIKVWQPTPEHKVIINLPATVESSTPNVFADQVEFFCSKVDKRDSVIISIHTHNDRGCAVAAAELALLAGADRIEGTLMGNGERTGNMDIVTMAMNLYSQGIDPKLDISDALRITQTVEKCTQIPTHPRHPWVGELVYTAFSGSHQDAIKKCLDVQIDSQPWDVAYLPIDPKDIGRDYQSVIRVNSQSGKGGVAYILEHEFGITLPKWMQIEVSQAVQRHSEQHGTEVTAQQIYAIFIHNFAPSDGIYTLGDYALTRDNKLPIGQQENLMFDITQDQQVIKLSAQADGPLSAFCQALSNYLQLNIEIKQYAQLALAEHQDANAISCISLEIAGTRYHCIAIANDTLGASLQALLNGINRHLISQAQAA